MEVKFIKGPMRRHLHRGKHMENRKVGKVNEHHQDIGR